MKRTAKISLDNRFKPDKGYKHSGAEGYNSNNGDFIFSDQIEKWKSGKANPTRKAKPLF